MTLRSTTVGLHQARQAQTAREAFIECRGASPAVVRQQQIDQLVKVDWKGKTLYTLRCQGTSGKGPHDTNVPESLLWALIDFRAFRCPYHCNDAPRLQVEERPQAVQSKANTDSALHFSFRGVLSA